jgi:hypothetical protein
MRRGVGVGDSRGVPIDGWAFGSQTLINGIPSTDNLNSIESNRIFPPNSVLSRNTFHSQTEDFSVGSHSAFATWDVHRGDSSLGSENNGINI